MYQVIYRCAYRDYWYDDIEPEDSLDGAMWTARQVYHLRRTPVCVVDLSTQQIVHKLPH